MMNVATEASILEDDLEGLEMEMEMEMDCWGDVVLPVTDTGLLNIQVRGCDQLTYKTLTAVVNP